MRLSRPCYDKPHRCPGWAGGGTRSAKVSRCENGSVRTRVPEPSYPSELKYPGSARWRFGHCVGNLHTGSEPCGIVTWPYALRWLDPRYVVGWKLRGAINSVKDRWSR